MQSYAFPLFSMISGVFKENSNRSGNFDHNGTVLVSATPSNNRENPPSFTKDYQFIDRSKSGKSCISRKRKFATSGMNSYRLWLLEESSIKSISLIKHAIRKGTRCHYESSWRKWDSWCRRREIDPIRCPLNNILDFLIDYFHEGYDEYCTIVGFRSAISAYHDLIQGVLVE